MTMTNTHATDTDVRAHLLATISTLTLAEIESALTFLSGYDPNATLQAIESAQRLSRLNDEQYLQMRETIRLAYVVGAES